MSNATEAAQYYQLLSNRLSKRDYTVQLENLESQDDNSWTTEFSFYPNKNSLQNKEAHVVYTAQFSGNHGCTALIKNLAFNVVPREDPRSLRDGEEKELKERSKYINSALNSLSLILKDSDGMALLDVTKPAQFYENSPLTSILQDLLPDNSTFLSNTFAQQPH